MDDRGLASGQRCDEDTLTIIDNRSGQRHTVPIREGHYVNAADLAPIADAGRGLPGLSMYDPFFKNTAVVRSAISAVDGTAGRLWYRGYAVEELVAKCSYLEVSHLLIYGHLPSASEYGDWSNQIMTHTFVHVKVNDLMRSFNYDAHPMGMFISAMAALSTFHPEANPSLAGSNCLMDSPSMVNKQVKRIIGKATTLAANAYCHRIGRPFNAPRNDMTYAGNFLAMMDSLGEPDYRPHPALEAALDKLFIIHAEHEMNCSTTAMMLISSTMVDPYSAIAGAASALYGPLHGGASEAVVRMLIEIGSVENVAPYLALVKAKERKLMGFGHRIYKSYDPRARLVWEILQDVLAVCFPSTGMPSAAAPTGEDCYSGEPLIRVALALERAALADEYFIARSLYPNVDFYSGLVYKAMGFPLDFYPLLFAIPRISGWLAHWREMMAEGSADVKIWRPLQVYTGDLPSSPTNSLPILPIGERPSAIAGGDGRSPLSASDTKPMYRRYRLSRPHTLSPMPRLAAEHDG